MQEVTDADTIQPGSRVCMHYTLRLQDGMVVDASGENEPIEFVMGDGTLIQGLELVLYGLKTGDRQSINIEPQDAFGFADEDNIHQMDRSSFPASVIPKEGMIVEFTTPSGDATPGAIKSVNEEHVTVDFNHPLAGHEVNFEVEIVAVSPPEGRSEK